MTVFNILKFEQRVYPKERLEPVSYSDVHKPLRSGERLRVFETVKGAERLKGRWVEYVDDRLVPRDGTIVVRLENDAPGKTYHVVALNLFRWSVACVFTRAHLIIYDQYPCARRLRKCGIRLRLPNWFSSRTTTPFSRLVRVTPIR
jgi:hypothetical protein